MALVVFDPNEQPNLSVTEKAIGFFKKKLAKEEQQALRISVKKSGCTGYAYVLDYGETRVEGDLEYVFGDLTIFVTEQAMSMIAGSEIDLQQQGLNKTIVFNNPNITASCGCGSSFSVDDADAEE